MTTLEEQRKTLLPILKVKALSLVVQLAKSQSSAPQQGVHLQRADEVQQQEPKVAYYCRLYAVHQVPKIDLGPSTASKHDTVFTHAQKLLTLAM